MTNQFNCNRLEFPQVLTACVVQDIVLYQQPPVYLAQVATPTQIITINRMVST